MTVMASKIKATHCQEVKVPDDLYVGFVVGSKGQNIKDLNKKLSGCYVTFDDCKKKFRVEGDSPERVLVGVKELQILIAEKRSYSHRISEWYSLVAAPPLELKPYDCSEKFFFEPKMKSNCTLYSLNMARPGKVGMIPKALMKNVLELFASHVSKALEEKGRCSLRMRARFGKVVHPVYCDTRFKFTECNKSDIEDDKGFLVDQIPKKFTIHEVCKENLKSFGHSTLDALIPQIKEHERMDELGKVTVLLIKAVFFNSNGCECEYAVLKCIKEEGSGMYHLVEVRKNPKEVTCDCLFLDYCHDIRVVLSVDTEEDMRFSESMRSKAEQIIQAIREQENGSFSMVTRTEIFAVLQVRRSEKVHYKYKHDQQWYFLTRTADEQCHVHLMEEVVPKDGAIVDIIFDDKKYKELELFNPQWISNYSLLEQVTVEEAFKRHFFHLRDYEKRMFPPKEPTVDAFREELESFMKCARHIASYPST